MVSFLFSLFFIVRSSFSDFAQKYAKDERFKNVEKMREREGLFNEYLIEVRKRDKEEKAHRREQVGFFIKIFQVPFSIFWHFF